MGFMWSAWVNSPFTPHGGEVPPRGPLMAEARIESTGAYPALRGLVRFFAAAGLPGTVVSAEIEGLPAYVPGGPDAAPPRQPVGPFGFHIHDIGDCAQAGMASGGHYNPDGQPHGNHAGDLPPLFSNGGRALMSVYTDRFTPGQVVGRAVIIHKNPDDFRTQPSGNSGDRIGCGLIRAARRA